MVMGVGERRRGTTVGGITETLGGLPQGREDSETPRAQEDRGDGNGTLLGITAVQELDLGVFEVGVGVAPGPDLALVLLVALPLSLFGEAGGAIVLTPGGEQTQAGRHGIGLARQALLGCLEGGEGGLLGRGYDVLASGVLIEALLMLFEPLLVLISVLLLAPSDQPKERLVEVFLGVGRVHCST